VNHDVKPKTNSRQLKHFWNACLVRVYLVAPCESGAGGRESFNAIGVFEGTKRTGHTNKIANFRGTGHRMGNRAKQRTKQAKAARLHAPKTRRRSHLLTKAEQGASV